MDKIQTFTIQIRAVQWDGSDEAWHAIYELYKSCVSKDLWDITNEFPKMYIMARLSRDETMILRTSDWLVVDATNRMHVYEDESFKRLIKQP